MDDAINFVKVHEQISKQPIIYPFADELKELAAYEKAMMAGEQPSEAMQTEFNKFIGAITHGAHMYVATAVNIGQVLEKYATNIGTHVLPPVRIYLHQIQPGDGKIIEGFGRRMKDGVKEFPNTVSDWLKYDPMIRAGLKIRLKEIEGELNKNNPIYYSVKDPRLAEALAKRKIASIQGAEHETQTYISDRFLPAAYLTGELKPTIIPVHLTFNDGMGHATAIYIQPGRDGNEAFYFEPHVNAPWSQDIDKILTKLFRRMLKKFNIRYTSLVKQHCPRSLQSALIKDYGSCQTWTLLAMLMCALNPTVGKRELFGYMIGLGHNVRILLDVFIYHIYSLFDTGESAPNPRLANIEDSIAPAIADFTQYRDKLLAGHLAPNAISLLNAIIPARSWVWRGKSSKEVGTEMPIGMRMLMMAIAVGKSPEALFNIIHEHQLSSYIEMAFFLKEFSRVYPPNDPQPTDL